METFLLYGVLFVMSILVVVFVYFKRRNEAVYRMRERVNNACYKHELQFINSCARNHELLRRLDELNKIRALSDAMRHRNSYDKMYFSFRPLKIENWYTPTECEIIKKYGYED